MSCKPVRIRRGTMGDYDALAVDGPARTREQIGQWLAGPGSTVLVAEMDREVVGLAVLLTRPPPCFAGAVPLKMIELDNLVVRSGLPSRGVGRQLIGGERRLVAGPGASHIGVAAHSFNRDARRFYEGAGFAPSIDRLVLAM